MWEEHEMRVANPVANQVAALSVVVAAVAEQLVGRRLVVGIACSAGRGPSFVGRVAFAFALHKHRQHIESTQSIRDSTPKIAEVNANMSSLKGDVSTTSVVAFAFLCIFPVSFHRRKQYEIEGEVVGYLRICCACCC
jgi:hypothetical protein